MTQTLQRAKSQRGYWAGRESLSFSNANTRFQERREKPESWGLSNSATTKSYRLQTWSEASLSKTWPTRQVVLSFLISYALCTFKNSQSSRCLPANFKSPLHMIACNLVCRLCPYADICCWDGCANRCLNFTPPHNVFFRESYGVLVDWIMPFLNRKKLR